MFNKNCPFLSEGFPYVQPNISEFNISISHGTVNNINQPQNNYTFVIIDNTAINNLKSVGKDLQLNLKLVINVQNVDTYLQKTIQCNIYLLFIIMGFLASNICWFCR